APRGAARGDPRPMDAADGAARQRPTGMAECEGRLTRPRAEPHVVMRDAAVVVELALAEEAESAVEGFEIGLRADHDVGAGVSPAQALDGTDDEHSPEPAPPRRRADHDAPEARMRYAGSRRKAAKIADEAAVLVRRQQMVGRLVEKVEVAIGRVLL